MKFFRSEQIREIDEITIKDEPISSVDLMERAARQLMHWYISHFERSDRVFIFTGPGNNGGDGLALARMLWTNRFSVEIFHLNFTEKTSDDWKKNLLRVKSETDIPLHSVSSEDQFPLISAGDVIIDAIFGSGLTRKVDGLSAAIIKRINNTKATVISVDIPSGMFGEDNSKNNYEAIVRADHTLSFQFPKLSFMFHENAPFVGELSILPIGLSRNAIDNLKSPFTYLEKSEISSILKKRNKFDHKGVFGHGILYAGSYGKMGAAILGATAALRSGIGLVTCHVPWSGVPVLQTAIPEAMAEPDPDEKHLSETGNTDIYDAVAFGPGIGTDPESQSSLHKLLVSNKKPIVIDADGLNILSMNKDWFFQLPAGAILTPHPKEFERTAGKSANSFERLNRQIEFSRTHNCIVILKGANTSISAPDGKVFFNSTGNPGMATAGSGDALTGILLSLLSQGYTPEDAAVLGVYLHGLAGDFAAEELSYESIIASDIIKYLSDAFKSLKDP
jgi:ADP-dependent NAD(P)H-hydrate dehydratase / NAD(P)H-hydrate epimerase